MYLIIGIIFIIAAFWSGYYLGQDDQKDYDKLKLLDHRMLSKIKSSDPEFSKVVDDNFWDLINN